MEEWFEQYASALEDRLGRSEPGVHLSKQSRNPILTLARIVAHGTERKNAPLAAYMAGRYVSARTAQGMDEAAAVAEALEVAEEMTPTEQ